MEITTSIQVLKAFSFHVSLANKTMDKICVSYDGNTHLVVPKCRREKIYYWIAQFKC